jgi:hypothetical protein
MGCVSVSRLRWQVANYRLRAPWGHDSCALTGWATVFLMVGLFEEFLTREYLQYTLACGIGFSVFCISAPYTGIQELSVGCSCSL